MIISYLGEDKFKIKTKEAEVTLSAEKIDIDGFVIDGPGEYERKNIFVEAPFSEPTFKLLIEEVAIFYPGKTKKLSDKQIEEIDGVDLLFLPCGAGESMTLKDALELSATLEPSITIPMLFSNIDELHKSGIEGEATKNLKVTKATLPAETKEVFFLESVS